MAARPRLLPQVLRFVAVGISSTIGYALMFLLIRNQTGAAGTANVVALLSTTVVNTAANRMWTFGIRGRARAVRHHVQGLLILAAGLVVTTAALALAHGIGVHGATYELAVLTVANLLVTVGRFAAFRLLVFRTAGTAHAPAAAPGRPAPVLAGALVDVAA